MHYIYSQSLLVQFIPITRRLFKCPKPSQFQLLHIYSALRTSFLSGKPLLEMCWFYMGIAQKALDAPLCQMGKREKSAPNHPGQPLHLPLTGNAHMEATYFKKGLPYMYLLTSLKGCHAIIP